MKLSDLKLNPDNPRVIKNKKFKQLVDSLKTKAWMLKYRPIVVDDDMMVLGGNQRLKGLQELGYTEIPDEWVAKASELTEEQIKEFIIADNVVFGEWDWKVLEQKWNRQNLVKWGVDVVRFDTETMYTKKIETPIYVPSKIKPQVGSLFDTTKSDLLIKEIKAAKLDNNIEQFLIEAAKRHTIFSYSKIADFYAHSIPEVQKLMEDSGLIIIDFNRAIELGYVKLSEKIGELYGDDYGQ